MPTFSRDDETFEVAQRIPVLPLRDVVVFPYVVMPLLVGRSVSLAAVEAAAAGDKLLLLVAQKSAETNDPTSADLHRTGVLSRVLQVVRLPSGSTKVLVEGIARAKVTKFLSRGEFLRAETAPFPLARDEGDSGSRAAARRATELFEEYVGLHRRIPGEVLNIVNATPNEERQAWGIAAHTIVRHEIRQQFLEALSLTSLFGMLADSLGGEIELLKLERKIDDDVRGSLFQNQREFYLQEQLKAIHRELGNEDDDLDDVEEQIRLKALPEQVEARAMREVRKLRRMSPLSPESTVARNYLDWVLALPWTERTADVLDVARAREVLDEDHFGLEEVKERILDYIAVLALVGKLEGPILCLVGAPGVGKTSLGRSIARALGRKFVRMSLGGMRDEAEIRGHRRTYIGSMPGRIVQAMRRAEVVNPVLLLDEIDKLGTDYRGDPSAALLEVLDPEQNKAFNDHYLELDYDLSQVLFVTTANSLQSIPEPLRDRMEIIRLPGYLDHEKVAIARQYLLPRQLTANGVNPASVELAPGTLTEILRGYTREAGVRELERRIARIARKLARRRAEHPELTDIHDVIEPADLKALLGVPPFDPDEATTDDKVGVVNGLAYTSVGGEMLEIECAVVAGRGKLSLTGTLGDVMKESANAALSYIRMRSDALGLTREFYRTRDIHVHLPAGATPKDGPSAGIAICTALVSALTERPVFGRFAMTGEITLRGRVLPIGGLKEKAVAAHRNRIADVIIPHGNLRDVEELPQEVRDTVRFHPVKTMDEVLTLALAQSRTAPSGEIRESESAGKRKARAKPLPTPSVDPLTH